MSLFDDGSGSNDFDGALRERGPKIPPRRRRAPAADAESGAEGASESPAQPKKSSGGGWASGADVGTVPVRSTQPPSTAVGSIAEPGGKEDDDIMVIPDLEEADDDDMTAAVAEPGAVSGAALPTHLEDEQGQLPASMVSIWWLVPPPILWGMALHSR